MTSVTSVSRCNETHVNGIVLLTKPIATIYETAKARSHRLRDWLGIYRSSTGAAQTRALTPPRGIDLADPVSPGLSPR